MPYIVIHSALFTGGDRADSEDFILGLLGALSRRNLRWLKSHPETPKLYDSGVVYALPEQMEECKIPEGKLKECERYLRNLGAAEDTISAVVAFLRGVEMFRDIPTLIAKGRVDCFPLTQKIIVRSRSTGMYELVAIGDLRHAYIAYDALSYNFARREYEFKPIVGFVDKGVVPVSKARLSNGTDLVSTDSHKFWTLDGSRRGGLSLGVRTMGEYVDAYQGARKGRYSKTYRTEHSRILQAARIPTLDVVKPTAAEAYLAGIYAAEGYLGGGKRPWIAQHKSQVRAKIEQAVADAGGTTFYHPGGNHGKTTPGSGAAYYIHGEMASNPLLQRMRAQGEDSFDKRLPQSFLSGDAATIATMLEGHGDGDAWRPANGAYKRPNVEAVYATSSDELVEQLRLGLLALGRPFYNYRYEDHGGVGTEPIWRLHEYNDAATKLKSRAEMLEDDLPGLRYGTVRSAVPFGKAHVGCVEVEGNHNFFLADGTLVSNCDNLACMRVAELWLAGVAASPYITWRETDGGTTYHALVMHPDGTSEDPSRILGLGTEAERVEERRKNRERQDVFVQAARQMVADGALTLGEAVAKINALGFVGKKWPTP